MGRDMKYIAIDGRGGSGKTYLANMLGEKLNAHVLHLDDYGNDYEPFVGIPQLIEELDRQSGGPVIFEGVGVFDPRFDRFNALKIFVDTAPEVRKARAANRDVPRHDRSADEWKKIYDIWARAEAEYFTDSVTAKADMITGANGAINLDDICRGIR